MSDYIKLLLFYFHLDFICEECEQNGNRTESRRQLPAPRTEESSLNRFHSDRHSKIHGRTIRRGGWAPAQIRVRDHIFSFSKSKRPSHLASSLEVQRKSDAKFTHRLLCQNPSWLREMQVLTQDDPGIHQLQT